MRHRCGVSSVSDPTFVIVDLIRCRSMAIRCDLRGCFGAKDVIQHQSCLRRDVVAAPSIDEVRIVSVTFQESLQPW